MKKLTLAAAMCLIGVLATTAWCKDGRRSTEQERQDFLKGARTWEQDPLSDKAKEFRASALTWIEDVEDIIVTVDAGIVLPLVKEMPEDYRVVFIAQFVIECGVYAIRNEKKEADRVQRNVQALESCLRMYHALLKDHPDAKTDAVEKIDKLAADKKLASYVKEKFAE